MLLLDAAGAIRGFTAGNDVSSRSIEGENPLYLPQAKVYDGSCALGPGLLFTDTPLPPTTTIRLTIRRGGAAVFEGETTTGQIKRGIDELAGWLYRETTFPAGAYLFTGTGIVPPDAFTLAAGDEIAIGIDGIGTLTNTVA